MTGAHCGKACVQNVVWTPLFLDCEADDPGVLSRSWPLPMHNTCTMGACLPFWWRMMQSKDVKRLWMKKSAVHCHVTVFPAQRIELF